MRIVGGEWSGRRLAAPAGRGTRPTSDRVREAIFATLTALAARGELPSGDSIAAGPLAGIAALDLFAGSGALGLESLSRGAAHCTFVEREPAALKALRANLASLDCPPSRSHVVAGDALRAVEADVRRATTYTLVLVDAPYAAYAAFERRFASLVAALVDPGGVVVVETAKGQAVKLPLNGLAIKTYGKTQVTYLTRRVTCQRT